MLTGRFVFIVILNYLHKSLTHSFYPAGIGLELTTTIVNEERTRAGCETVGKSTVRTSAKKEYSGTCHKRRNTKTGNKDKESIWAKGRLHFGVQLQQQFRVDTPGPLMIGTRVVKIFDDDIAYTGWVTAYDEEEDWYHVVYDADGDQEDMTLDELRVSKWTRIDRRSVLWLDEKHKEIVLGSVSVSKDE